MTGSLELQTDRIHLQADYAEYRNPVPQLLFGNHLVTLGCSSYVDALLVFSLLSLQLFVFSSLLRGQGLLCHQLASTSLTFCQSQERCSLLYTHGDECSASVFWPLKHTPFCGTFNTPFPWQAHQCLLPNIIFCRRMGSQMPSNHPLTAPVICFCSMFPYI